MSFAQDIRDAAMIIERDNMVASEAAHYLRKIADGYEPEKIGDEFKPVDNPLGDMCFRNSPVIACKCPDCLKLQESGGRW
jgi:hypothetical protein